jgi:SAM-dependent methyltransferase
MTNEAQIAYWNEVAGPKWVKLGDDMDARFAVITAALLKAAAPAAGERILEIGCGTGSIAARLADAVQPGGQVTGIDISAPMLGVAKARNSGAEFWLADAQTHDFGGAVYDLLVSRFGVMFFEDPLAAFTNLRKALAAGGRLAFVCWARLRDNPQWQIPFEIVVQELGAPAPREKHAPGPLAFSDTAYVEGFLEAAGFTGVSITPVPVPMIGGSLAEEVQIACTLGPAAALIEEKQADAATRARLAEKFAVALAPFETPEGMRSPATIFVVTAKG